MYVLVARHRKAGRKKIEATWTGPYLITGANGPLVKEVTLVGFEQDAAERTSSTERLGTRFLVHVDRIKLLSAGPLNETEEYTFRRQARLSRGVFFADRIVSFRVNESSNELEFEVKYRGFPDPSDNSWESLSHCSTYFEKELREFLSENRADHPRLEELWCQLGYNVQESKEENRDGSSDTDGGIPRTDFEDEAENRDAEYTSYIAPRQISIA
jgi:hypothetical protein